MIKSADLNRIRLENCIKGACAALRATGKSVCISSAEELEIAMELASKSRPFHQDVAHADDSVISLVEALQDMLGGWKYIRSTHGDLYGVGWDRAQGKAEKALREFIGGDRT